MHVERIAPVLLVAATLCLGACSPPAAPQPDKAAGAAVHRDVKAIHAPLDKAKGVEGQVQAAHDAQDKQIEADTQ